MLESKPDMFERDNLTEKQHEELNNRFDVAKEHWDKAVREGRAHNTEFYYQLFQSEETPIYRERGNGDLLFHAARTLNASWVGDPRSIYIK